MNTLRPLRTAVVTGSEGGLGRLVVHHLTALGYDVVRWDVTTGVDVTSPLSVSLAVNRVGVGQVAALVNCAGFNRLASVGDLTCDVFDHHMHVNARAMMLCVQGLLDKLRGGAVCNVVSNASHMPMRMSLAYNASKAAAAMITRQMARELGQPHDLTIFGVSPNRLAGTPMSNSVDEQVASVRGWTAEEVRKRQLEALPIGEETDPNVVAEFIGFLLSAKQRHKYLHGAILEYGI